MPAELRSSGPYVYGSTSVAVPYPANIAAGDMLLLFVAYKDAGLLAAARDGAQPLIAVTGFTSFGTLNGGYGSGAAGQGPVGGEVYYRTAVGNETGTVTYSDGGQNVMGGVMLAFAKTPGSNWVTPVMSQGAINAMPGSTSLAFSMAPAMTLQPNDLLVDVFGIQPAVTNETRFYSSAALNAPGFTSASFPLIEGATTTGRDLGIQTGYFRILTGSGTTTTFQVTASAGSTTNAGGPAAVVRLRDDAVGVPSVRIWDGSKWNSNLKVWNGTAWKSDFKVWNGTAWKQAGSGLLVPPVADFYASVGGITAPQSVTFTNTSTGTITSYLWDFDVQRTGRVTPQKATGAGPHTVNYTSGPMAGFRIVSLTVGNNDGFHTKLLQINNVP